MPDEETKDPAATSWHFDKRIPLALIGTIILQTGAAIWWASSVNSYIDDDRRGSVAMSERLTSVERDNSTNGNRMTRVEVLLETQGELLKEIRDTVKGQ
jgi:hypothetical protein